jgi:histidine ammonia-lyase
VTDVEVLGGHLTAQQLLRVAGGAGVRIDPACHPAVERSAAYVADIARDPAGRGRYGINTGFGRNAGRVVDAALSARLQQNLVISHALGAGAELPRSTVRAMMALRVHTLLRGHSGIRLEVLQQMIDMLDRGVVPVVSERGSVGASGDLAPLSCVAAAMMGQGQAWCGDERLPAAEALARAGLAPVALQAKEGLALINGTTLMTVLAAEAVERLRGSVDAADGLAALSIEALAGRVDAFDERVHALRGHPGQIESARRLRAWLADSQLAGCALELAPQKGQRPQDPYSFRCAPQVHGAVRDALAYAEQVVDRELQAVTDNPILFPDTDDVISAGNFHGMPIALALTAMKTAVAPLGSIAERRLATLLDASMNDGLPPFLTGAEPGLNSGLMIPQYLAASLVNAIAVRSMPATAFSVPTCANTEDHVSMGPSEAYDLREMLSHLRSIQAAELLVAAQGIELRQRQMEPLAGRLPEPAAKSRQVLAGLRQQVPSVVEDCMLQSHYDGAARYLDSPEWIGLLTQP